MNSRISFALHESIRDFIVFFVYVYVVVGGRRKAVAIRWTDAVVVCFTVPTTPARDRDRERERERERLAMRVGRFQATVFSVFHFVAVSRWADACTGKRKEMRRSMHVFDNVVAQGVACDS